MTSAIVEHAQRVAVIDGLKFGNARVFVNLSSATLFGASHEHNKRLGSCCYESDVACRYSEIEIWRVLFGLRKLLAALSG